MQHQKIKNKHITVEFLKQEEKMNKKKSFPYHIPFKIYIYLAPEYHMFLLDHHMWDVNDLI